MRRTSPRIARSFRRQQHHLPDAAIFDLSADGRDNLLIVSNRVGVVGHVLRIDGRRRGRLDRPSIDAQVLEADAEFGNLLNGNRPTADLNEAGNVSGQHAIPAGKPQRPDENVLVPLVRMEK
jgi:hypothetical protein